MIAVLARTYPPTAIDTIEALCDAIARDDHTTEKTMITMSSIDKYVRHALKTLNEIPREVGTSYNAQIIREWDESNASFAIVSIPLPEKEESLRFTCRFVVNQWTIIAMQIDSSNMHMDS